MNTKPCPTCGGPRFRGTSKTMYPKFCSEACKPRCGVSGCETATRKFVGEIGVCALHYTRYRRTGAFGEAAPLRVFSDGGRCRNCECVMSSPFPVFGWLCSARCSWRFYERPVGEFDSWDCVTCGALILASEARVDTRRCDACAGSRRGRPKPSLTALELAVRDGALCGICGTEVDLLLSGNDLMGPTADHIVPLSLYGGNLPANLQLAHRLCNLRKSNTGISVRIGIKGSGI